MGRGYRQHQTTGERLSVMEARRRALKERLVREAVLTARAGDVPMPLEAITRAAWDLAELANPRLRKKQIPTDEEVQDWAAELVARYEPPEIIRVRRRPETERNDPT